MILSILRLGYAICDVISIGTGIVVLFGLLTGELLDRWATHFLRYTLATSVTGLLFPLHDFTLVQRCSMLAVYTSGMAILAWRKYHLSGIWRSIFPFAISITFYLNVVVLFDHALDHIFRFTGLTPPQSELTSRTTQLFVMLLFAMIGIVAVKRFKDRAAGSVRSETIRSANS
jgi:hypothetical protein